MNIIEHNKNGLVYLTADGFEAAGGVAHGFSTRLGGVSEGIAHPQPGHEPGRRSRPGTGELPPLLRRHWGGHGEHCLRQPGSR